VSLSLVTLNNPSLLLLYLAYRGDWVSRSELAFLFRPDEDEATAKLHVRVLLHRAKSLSWAASLATNKRQAKLAIATDVHAFKTAFREQDWKCVIALYSGPFLAGVSAADLPTYSAWLDLERSDLQTKFQTARTYAKPTKPI
jgi:DNA-binding SARP family transcriptional activator